MYKLLIESVRLMFRFWYLIPLRLIKVFQGKLTMNEFVAQLEMNKLENRLHFWQTLYFCFRTMPIRYALKTPVWIYGKTYFYNLSGKVEPISPENVYSGAVKIGLMDQTRSISDANSLTISGTFRYGHNIIIRQGAKWKVGGMLSIDSHCMVADNVSFFVSKSVAISSNCVIAFNSMFMDSDVHYMIDVNTMRVKNNTRSIFIGKGCWLGGYTMVKKGTILPDYTIVVGPYSSISKDYIKVLEPYSCIGGNPAKFIKAGFREINNSKWEKYFNNYFCNNKELYFYEGNIEELCTKTNSL